MAPERPGGTSRRARVLVADPDARSRAWLRTSLGDGYEVVEADSAASARELLARGDPAIDVVVAGTELGDGRGAGLLAEVHEARGGRISLFLADASEGGPGGDHGDDVPVFYVLTPSVAPDRVEALVASAVASSAVPDEGIRSVDDASRTQRVLEISRRLAAQADLRGAARVATAAAVELLDADRAYCLFHDASSGALWREDGEDGDGSAHGHGLALFAARTRRPVSVARAGDEPLYRGEVDDPRGDGGERLACQPIAGPGGEVHAVLVVVRTAGKPPFDDGAMRWLAELASAWGPFLHQLALGIEAGQVLDSAAGADRDPLFRREALEAYAMGQHSGDVVRVSPSWMRWAYWVVVAAIAAAAVYVSVGTVDEYSRGPAVISMTGRTEVTARASGTIQSVAVAPGARVEAGALLARMYAADETAELERLERQFESQLVNVLRNPADETARGALASLAAQRERAAARLEERTIRAPHAGVVSDVRIRPGQPLQPGDLVLSLVDDANDLSVVAFLPGGARPRLRPGQTLRLELSGYRYAYQDLTVARVGAEVVGPSEARRYLGARLGDALPITGPVVLVEAALDATTFEADGTTFHFHDGMQGTAEVRVRSQRIVRALIPGLDKL